MEQKETKAREGTRGISGRGRKFQGTVIRKFEKRVTIIFEKTRFNKKYSRYEKSKTKMHAYLPENMKDEINIGDYIQIQECRPISKITHGIVVKKIRSAEGRKEK